MRNNVINIADRRKKKAAAPVDPRLELLHEYLKMKPRAPMDLEQVIHEVEAKAIRFALDACDGDIDRASLWLGYRTPAALRFVLKRHPKITA